MLFVSQFHMGNEQPLIMRGKRQDADYKQLTANNFLRMTMTIQQQLEKFIAQELLLGQETTIDPDQSLTSSGIIDSLSLLRIIAFIEDTFQVEIDDTELSPDHFETLNVMVALIEGKLNSSNHQ